MTLEFRDAVRDALAEELERDSSVVFFGESAPKNTGGLVLAIALSIAAMFAIGLAIAAGARTPGAARGIMMATFYPLMFFSGLYIPMQLLPGALQDISHFTPLGAAVDPRHCVHAASRKAGVTRWLPAMPMA